MQTNVIFGHHNTAHVCDCIHKKQHNIYRHVSSIIPLNHKIFENVNFPVCGILRKFIKKYLFGSSSG